MQTDARGHDRRRTRTGAESYSTHAPASADQLAFVRAGRWVLVAASGASVLLMVTAGQSPRLLLAIPFALCVIASWFLFRTGSHEAGYRVGVYGTWASTLIGLLVFNGVNGPTVSIFAVVLMMAGWLLSSRSTVLLTVLTTLALVLLTIAEQSRWPLPISYPSPPYYAAIVHSGVAICAALLGYFSSKALRSQLHALRVSRNELESSVTELVARESELRRIQGDLAVLNANLEQIVQERTVHLRTAMRDLETFSYSVSHDLRTPLRAIAGYLEDLVEAEAGPQDDKLRSAEAIRRNIRRMGELIDGLLELARVNRAGLQQSRVDMQALLSEILEQFVHQHSRVEMQVDDIPDAVGDPLLVRQVLTNLVGNALKYSARAENPRVHVGWSESDRAWFVRDNGIGFDMRDADRLFNTFQRLPEAKDFEGTGVGLAVVKSIVERHGGTVWAAGQLQAGATFYFTLPAAATEPPASGDATDGRTAAPLELPAL